MTILKSSNSEYYFTKREIQVLRLLVLGKTNAQIAEELCISPYTAKKHVCSVIHKLYVKDRLQVAVKAAKEGWV